VCAYLYQVFGNVPCAVYRPTHVMGRTITVSSSFSVSSFLITYVVRVYCQAGMVFNLLIKKFHVFIEYKF
jgi:hypothetical protein